MIDSNYFLLLYREFAPCSDNYCVCEVVYTHSLVARTFFSPVAHCTVTQWFFGEHISSLIHVFFANSWLFCVLVLSTVSVDIYDTAVVENGISCTCDSAGGTAVWWCDCTHTACRTYTSFESLCTLCTAHTLHCERSKCGHSTFANSFGDKKVCVCFTHIITLHISSSSLMFHPSSSVPSTFFLTANLIDMQYLTSYRTFPVPKSRSKRTPTSVTRSLTVYSSVFISQWSPHRFSQVVSPSSTSKSTESTRPLSSWFGQTVSSQRMTSHCT